MSVYVIDSNVLIQAHRTHYPLDIFTSFWNAFKNLAKREKIISIDRVKEEIYKNDDALKTWCLENLLNTFFKSSEETLEEYAKVVNWANDQFENGRYNQTALDEFMQAEVADAWLISYAKTLKEAVIVTQEKDDNSPKRIKIPTACNAFNVRYIDVITMLRELKVDI